VAAVRVQHVGVVAQVHVLQREVSCRIH
jgi:hypothetical protein